MKHVDNIMAMYVFNSFDSIPGNLNRFSYQSYDDYMSNIPSYDVNSIAVYLEQEDMKKKEKVLYENDRLKDVVLWYGYQIGVLLSTQINLGISQICCDSNVSHRLISKVASDMSCCGMNEFHSSDYKS